jgi:hypothetical protein
LRKHPVVERLVALIRSHQLALVLRGEFGVQSQARAAAPAIMQNLVELAGVAAPDAAGTRPGRATRDADSIRAGELVLDVGGYRVQRHAHQHLHMVVLEQMSDQELERFATDGTYPERLHEALGPLGTFTDRPALPAPAVNGSVAGPGGGPRQAREAGRE